MASSSATHGRPATQSVRKRVRTRKEDSAFLYALFEAHEGIVSYTTLPHQAGDAHRDLELRIPPDFVAEVESLLKELGDMVYELD